MPTIEIRALAENGSEVIWVPKAEAKFFGIYIGEPGSFEWVADFAIYDHARGYAEAIAEITAATFQDRTLGEAA